MADEEENEQPKKSPLRFVLLAVAVVVLGAGGFVGWSLFVKGEGDGDGSATQASPSGSKRVEQTPGVIFPLESFIVNLLDRSGSGKRYLKVTIELEVENDQDSILLQKHKTRLRDTIILLLSSQSLKEINTMEGKLHLKQSLLTRVNQILGGRVVQRLYFTEFVVQ